MFAAVAQNKVFLIGSSDFFCDHANAPTLFILNYPVTTLPGTIFIINSRILKSRSGLS